MYSLTADPQPGDPGFWEWAKTNLPKK